MLCDFVPSEDGFRPLASLPPQLLATIGVSDQVDYLGGQILYIRLKLSRNRQPSLDSRGYPGRALRFVPPWPRSVQGELHPPHKQKRKVLHSLTIANTACHRRRQGK